jgi:phosphonate transport system permease protein
MPQADSIITSELIPVRVDQPHMDPVRQPDCLIQFKKLRVSYPGCERPALEEVSLKVREGETIALLGPSGSGKTTLLRAIEGTVPGLQGRVRRSGRIAMVYQDLRLVQELTVLQNVCLGTLGHAGRWKGLLGFPAGVKRFALEIIRDLGLAELINRRVGSLSGGQRQRVAIARAICSRPAVLLADEPLAALDPENALRCLKMLTRLQKQHGFAMILSLHHAALIPGYFQRYLLVRDGTVAELDRELVQSARPAGVDPLAKMMTASHLPENKESRLTQDRDLDSSSFFRGLMIRLGLVVFLVLILGWAANALSFHGSSFSGAWSGLKQFAAGVLPENWAAVTALPWKSLGLALLETIQMALLGTAIGIFFSLPFSVMAARQTGPPVVRWLVRFLLNMIRTVPSILWALIFVVIVGLGPVAGVFALAAYASGYLTKFFYEALEDVDDRPAKALLALGATRLQVFVRAILPAARPALVGACLFMLEYNVRSASILGLVGAGGIGEDLFYYFGYLHYREAMAGLFLILIVVVLLDAVSSWWRKRLTLQRGL